MGDASSPFAGLASGGDGTKLTFAQRKQKNNDAKQIYDPTGDAEYDYRTRFYMNFDFKQTLDMRTYFQVHATIADESASDSTDTDAAPADSSDAEPLLKWKFRSPFISPPIDTSPPRLVRPLRPSREGPLAIAKPQPGFICEVSQRLPARKIPARGLFRDVATALSYA